MYRCAYARKSLDMHRKETYTQSSIHKGDYTQKRTRTHTHIHVYTHIQKKLPCIYRRDHAHTRTFIHTRTHTHSCIHTKDAACKRDHAHTHTFKYIHTCTSVYMCECLVHVCMYCVYMYTQYSVRLLTLLCMYVSQETTHTHTHSHTYIHVQESHTYIHKRPRTHTRIHV